VSPQHAKTDYRLKDQGLWPHAWKYAAAVGAVGLLLAVAGYAADPHRFGYSYLFAFMTVLTLVFGGLFLVIAEHLTVSYWGVTTRRLAELVMMGVVVVFLLALPLFAGVATNKLTLYSEWSAPHHGETGEHGGGEGEHDQHSTAPALFGAATAHADDGAPSSLDFIARTPMETALHHELLEQKSGWLNVPSWLGRSFVYFFIWIATAFFYFRNSVAQDKSRDPKLTVKMTKWSAPLAIAFGLSLTFAAFDWLMALEPTWYSTIFGVIIFGGSATAILALLVLMGLGLYKAGQVGEAINVEHFHDLSRLMYGFCCFWTYVSFAQWMLIWYAGIPEEAGWYHARWNGGWQWVSVLLVLGHFVVPFYALISRVQKRNLQWLQAMAFWLLAFHVIDIYWFVMPHATEIPQLQISWIDLGCLMFTGGVFFAFVFQGLKRFPLVPVGDPRFERCLHLHQTY
jgi:hypothetical protein